jgi:uncharacterized protein (TIGR03437 family)
MKTTLFALLAGFAWQVSAQPAFDSSGDGMLNGTYYLRQVFYVVGDQSGTLSDTMNVQGTIAFDGQGKYTFNGSFLDGASGASPTTISSFAGTYTISASGFGFIKGMNPNFTGDAIYGLVSHGVFVGSSTDNSTGYNDLFIAAPMGSAATNTTFKGTYSVAYLNPTFPGDALFQLTADGKGNIGTVNATGYLGSNTSASTQTLNGVTYSFNNGAAQLNLSGSSSSSALLGGTESLYISPDGNFVFGGNANGFDMFVGVRAASGKPSNYDNLYYQAGIDLNESQVASQGAPLLDSYYGSLVAKGGKIVGHQRTFSPLVYGGTSDFTYFDSYTLNGDGSSDDNDFGQHYISSADGTIRIGYGIGPFLSLNVAVQAPAFSGSGVYLNPAGVVNAASSAPFTASLSPGEFLSLYGSGLAEATMTASSVPLPTTLGKVQVTINGRAAPLFAVSPSQIDALVPYLTEPVAQIRVINNGSSSNTVTEFVGGTSAGVFTENPVGGIGEAAALHPNFTRISSSSPAQIGETVAVYLTGLGAVSPAVSDGADGPSNPLSKTTNTPSVFLFDSAGRSFQATVTYSGLAPELAGLYQLNFTIPGGMASGEASLEVFGGTSDSLEAVLPVGSVAASSAPAVRGRGAAHLLIQQPLARRTMGQAGAPRPSPFKQ